MPDHPTPEIDPSMAQWLRDHLAESGRTIRGEVEVVHIRPTATVLAVATDKGKVFFKAPIPPLAYEIPLTVQLAGRFPTNSPAVLAADLDRGWFLMTDAGPRVRDWLKEGGDPSRWDSLLQQYVRLQHVAADSASKFVAMGVPDHRLAAMPGLYRRLIEDEAALMVGHRDGVTAEQLAALRAYEPTVVALCARLAAYQFPETVQHDDFHSGNAAVRGDDCVIIDWGDSCIAHPLYSVVISLRDARYILKRDQLALDHMRGVYLAAWADSIAMPLARVEEAFTIAAQLAALCRALTWHRIVTSVAERDRGEYADSVPYWALTFLNNTPFDA